MIYWDSSALVASIISEKATPTIRSLVASIEESPSYTSIITPLEVESAIQRKLAEKSITLAQADEVRRLLASFRKSVFLLVADQNVLDIALHLQKIHHLRVADSLQLASARAGTEDPSKTKFLCLDKALNKAAELEGFEVPF